MLFLVLFFKSQVCNGLKQEGIYAIGTKVVHLTIIEKMTRSEIKVRVK